MSRIPNPVPTETLSLIRRMLSKKTIPLFKTRIMGRDVVYPSEKRVHSNGLLLRFRRGGLGQGICSLQNDVNWFSYEQSHQYYTPKSICTLGREPPESSYNPRVVWENMNCVDQISGSNCIPGTSCRFFLLNLRHNTTLDCRPRYQGSGCQRWVETKPDKVSETSQPSDGSFTGDPWISDKSVGTLRRQEVNEHPYLPLPSW